jgi:signal transduction histidine kinase
MRSTIEAEKLLITVTDNGIGLPVKNEMELGIGLASTCERLEKMYPQQHSFSIHSLPERGTQVQVSIPLRFAAQHVGVIANEQTAPVGR